MLHASDTGHPCNNLLLGALPAEDYRRLVPQLEVVQLEQKQVLCTTGEPIGSVYFPSGGIVSLLVSNAEGVAVEAANVGHEGVVGLDVFLEVGASPGEAMVQVPGEAARISADAFLQAVDESMALHRLLHRYTLALLHEIARTAACNRLHPLEARLARWLMLLHDRCGGDHLALTQEFAAQLLGVRRASVAKTLALLTQAGLIRRTRGGFTVLDWSGVQRMACEDYGATRDMYDRVLTCDPTAKEPLRPAFGGRNGFAPQQPAPEQPRP